MQWSVRDRSPSPIEVQLAAKALLQSECADTTNILIMFLNITLIFMLHFRRVQKQRNVLSLSVSHPESALSRLPVPETCLRSRWSKGCRSPSVLTSAGFWSPASRFAPLPARLPGRTPRPSTMDRSHLLPRMPSHEWYRRWEVNGRGANGLTASTRVVRNCKPSKEMVPQPSQSNLIVEVWFECDNPTHLVTLAQ